MLVKTKNDIFLTIKERLLTSDFASLFREKVRNKELKLYKANPHLIEFVASYTGINQEDVKSVWDKVFNLLIKIYHGRVKIKKVETDTKIRINILATSLFYSLYEHYGSDASEVMYNLLEPIMTSALAGDKTAVEKARLLFIPISSENVDDIIKLAKEILESNKDMLCKEDILSRLKIICSQSSLLPSVKKGNPTTKGVEYCLRKLKQVLGVCEE